MLHNKTGITKFSWTILGVIRESEKTDGQEVKAMMREYDLDKIGRASCRERV